MVGSSRGRYPFVRAYFASFYTPSCVLEASWIASLNAFVLLCLISYLFSIPTKRYLSASYRSLVCCHFLRARLSS